MRTKPTQVFDFTEEDRQDEQVVAIRELTESVNALNALFLGFILRSNNDTRPNQIG